MTSTPRWDKYSTLQTLESFCSFKKKPLLIWLATSGLAMANSWDISKQSKSVSFLGEMTTLKNCLPHTPLDLGSLGALLGMKGSTYSWFAAGMNLSALTLSRVGSVPSTSTAGCPRNKWGAKIKSRISHRKTSLLVSTTTSTHLRSSSHFNCFSKTPPKRTQVKS